MTPFGTDAPWTPAPGEVLTVSELVGRVRGLLESGLPSLWVEGEVSNLRVPASGHAYFTLGDVQGQIRAVCFRNVARLLRLSFADGVRVLVRGRLTVYEARGDLQLIVEDAEPLGEGLRRLELEALRRRLAEEGLFAEARKRPLPELPRGVGVVTSGTGAALRDILQVLGRRAPGVHVYVAPARVQGEGAAEELGEALALVADREDVEVVILGRGGGSAEDLSAFNDEALVRAVASCPVPVIAAVGHETDVTLVDFAADVRAPTPSAAAELAVRERARWVERLERRERELGAAMQRAVSLFRARAERVDPTLRSPRSRIARVRIALDARSEALSVAGGRVVAGLRAEVAALEARLALADPARTVAVARERLGRLRDRLGVWGPSAVASRRGSVASLTEKLGALSPLGVLARGYAVARAGSGRVIRDARQCLQDDDVTVTLARGGLDCRVTRVRTETGRG